MGVKVGVVIPIYNVENYLKECLDSVLSQTYKDIEVVLVNDASTDENSLNIAKEYTLKDDRFILIDKENGGQSVARNVGIEYFSGEFVFNCCNAEAFDSSTLLEFDLANENVRAIKKIYKSSNFFKTKDEILHFKNPNIDYIVFLDSDDYWDPLCIEECIKRSEGVDIVWFNYTMFYDDIAKKHYENKTNLLKSQLQIYEYYKPEKISSKQWLQRCLKIQADLPFWCVWGGIYSFAYLSKIKLKFLDGLIHEDVHFGILLFSQANYIYVLPKILYYYRIRPASTSSYDGVLKIKAYPAYIENLCEAFGGDFKAAKQYHATSSIFLNAYYIREFIKNNLDEEKGILLEEAFFMFLYFWYFDFVEIKKDPRNVKELFLLHKPVYKQNYDRYPEFDFFHKYGLSRYRIKKQLSYRLGRVMIEKSKNFLSFLLMPFFILKTVFEFVGDRKAYLKSVNKDPSKKLPKIEDYPDYLDTYNVKEHLSYKIGYATLKAFKEWYKGKVFILPFTIYKINKKKKTQKNNAQFDRLKTEVVNEEFTWKEENLVNISNGKKAIQSSFDSILYSNTSTVLQKDFIVHNYAFATSKEYDYSWVVIDLETVNSIEKIRIINTKNFYNRRKAKDLYVEVSLDGNYWTTLGKKLNKWKYNNFYCELDLCEFVSARYIRIALGGGVRVTPIKNRSLQEK